MSHLDLNKGQRNDLMRTPNFRAIKGFLMKKYTNFWSNYEKKCHMKTLENKASLSAFFFSLFLHSILLLNSPESGSPCCIIHVLFWQVYPLVSRIFNECLETEATAPLMKEQSHDLISGEISYSEMKIAQRLEAELRRIGEPFIDSSIIYEFYHPEIYFLWQMYVFSLLDVRTFFFNREWWS